MKRFPVFLTLMTIINNGSSEAMHYEDYEHFVGVTRSPYFKFTSTPKGVTLNFFYKSNDYTMNEPPKFNLFEEQSYNANNDRLLLNFFIRPSNLYLNVKDKVQPLGDNSIKKTSSQPSGFNIDITNGRSNGDCKDGICSLLSNSVQNIISQPSPICTTTSKMNGECLGQSSNQVSSNSIENTFSQPSDDFIEDKYKVIFNQPSDSPIKVTFNQPSDSPIKVTFNQPSDSPIKVTFNQPNDSSSPPNVNFKGEQISSQASSNLQDKKETSSARTVVTTFDDYIHSEEDFLDDDVEIIIPILLNNDTTIDNSIYNNNNSDPWQSTASNDTLVQLAIKITSDTDDVKNDSVIKPTSVNNTPQAHSADNVQQEVIITPPSIQYDIHTENPLYTSSSEEAPIIIILHQPSSTTTTEPLFPTNEDIIEPLKSIYKRFATHFNAVMGTFKFWLTPIKLY